MLLRPLFFFLLVLALFGDARIFLFFWNRVVFGGHREETNPYSWSIFLAPPVLLGLTLLFWPLSTWVDRVASASMVERVVPDRVEAVDWDPIARNAGAVWLILAAATGLYWIVDRARVTLFGEVPVPGARTLGSEVVRLRKAHIPFASLRRLGAHNDLYDLEITRHEVTVDDLPAAFDGYRIAFLTDTHVASFMRRAFYREAVAQTLRANPDLILLGGDFVSFHRDIPLMAELLLEGLTAPDGVFAILGNHDYWAGGSEVRAAMEAKGVEFLINRRIDLRRGDEVIDLAGIDEIYRGEPDVAGVFDRADPHRPCIAVSHHPDIFDLTAGRRIDLLVCGHTHGGQIRFPFFGAVVVPSRHEATYASGFHREGRRLMYVSRGLGAIPPLRILCKPEIALFTLRRAQGAVMSS